MVFDHQQEAGAMSEVDVSPLVDIAKYQHFVEVILQPRLEQVMDDREHALKAKTEYAIAAKKLAELLGNGNDLKDEKVHTLVDIGCGVHVNAVSRTTLKSLKVHVRDEKGFIEMTASKALETTTTKINHLTDILEKMDKNIAHMVDDIEGSLGAIAQLKTLEKEEAA